MIFTPSFCQSGGEEREFTCSSDSWEMWLTAAYDSILGLKWLMMALRGNKGSYKGQKHFAVLYFLLKLNLRKEIKKVGPGEFFHIHLLLLLNPTVALFGVRRGHILISKH